MATPSVEHERSMRRIAIAAIAAFECAFAPARAGDASAPMRHLVYSFTYESRQNGTIPNDPGPGRSSAYTGNLDDSGTITVDVMKEATDRGLVVSVTEQGRSTRSAAAATCAVYGDTNVVCDPTKQINGEEYTLLRFLGVKFIEPARVDAGGHWTISQGKAPMTVTASYTIESNDDGAMKIEETRHVKDTTGGITTIDTQTKMDYNWKRLLPTAIDEYSSEDRHAGVNGVASTVYQTTLTLQSDSMAKQ